MKNQQVYNVASSNILSAITGDKIILGMGLILVLSVVGAVIDNSYSLKFGGDSFDLHR